MSNPANNSTSNNGGGGGNMVNYLRNDFLKLIADSGPGAPRVTLDNRKVYAELEQLRQVMNVLLHFKYMLVFVRKNFPMEVDFKLKSLAPDFGPDLDLCLSQCNQLLESCIFYDSARKQEEFYDMNVNSYCSFKRQYLFVCGGGGDSTSIQPQQHQLSDHQPPPLSDSLVDTIISEQSLDLPDVEFRPGGPETSTPMIGNERFNPQQPNSSAIGSQLQQQQQHLPMDVDPSNKVLYGNMMDILPNKPPPSTSSKPVKEACCDVANYHQPSASGHKRVPRQKASERQQMSQQQSKQQQPVVVQQPPTMILESSEDSESMHVENDLLQVEYWCSFEGCRFKSKSLTQVKAHEERRHVKQIVKCAQDGCGSFFDTKDDLNEHMTDTHSGPLFRCALNVCAKEFQSDYRLKQHIREEHKEEYLTCKVCTKKFKTRKYLTRHFRNVHPKEKITDEMATTLSSLDSKSNPMKCTIDNCDQKFGKRSKLKQHIKEEHKEEYLTCKHCDKVCKTRNNLTNHIWIMHEEGDFKCTFDECDFSSRYRKNLLNHKKLRHQRVRQCPMNDCGEMIPITRYQRHMSSLHKIKNYACSWPDCGKSFADHNALKNHVRIHLNFKRYKCKWPECGYASEQRFTVITHIRVCHFKLPRTKKKQLEMNISQDSLQNPYDYLEVCREDICI